MRKNNLKKIIKLLKKHNINIDDDIILSDIFELVVYEKIEKYKKFADLWTFKDIIIKKIRKDVDYIIDVFFDTNIEYSVLADVVNYHFDVIPHKKYMKYSNKVVSIKNIQRELKLNNVLK